MLARPAVTATCSVLANSCSCAVYVMQLTPRERRLQTSAPNRTYLSWGHAAALALVVCHVPEARGSDQQPGKAVREEPAAAKTTRRRGAPSSTGHKRRVGGEGLDSFP
jgi:hypothetical protein